MRKGTFGFMLEQRLQIFSYLSQWLSADFRYFKYLWIIKAVFCCHTQDREMKVLRGCCRQNNYLPEFREDMAQRSLVLSTGTYVWYWTIACGECELCSGRFSPTFQMQIHTDTCIQRNFQPGPRILSLGTSHVTCPLKDDLFFWVRWLGCFFLVISSCSKQAAFCHSQLKLYSPCSFVGHYSKVNEGFCYSQWNQPKFITGFNKSMIRSVLGA